MNKVFLVLRALFGYFIVGVMGILCGIPLLFIACLPASLRYENRIYYWFLDLFYKAGVWATFLSINVVGKENLPHQGSVIVANHQSAFDIPLIGSILNGYPHVWYFLARFAKIPIFGFITRRMNIVVDHSGLRKLTQSIDNGLSVIKHKKMHVLIFPEGGRWTDDQVHKFFYGFAVIAQKTGRPVVPIYIDNIGKAYPPGSFLLYPYPITIIIGQSFTMEQNESVEDFVARVYAWFTATANKR